MKPNPIPITTLIVLLASATAWAGGVEFTAHQIATDSAYSVVTADLDGDGDLDVLSGERWYENDNGSYTAHSITSVAAVAACATNPDRDGDVDVVVAGGSFGNSGIRWYENDGIADPNDGEPDPSFSEHVVTADYVLAVACAVADLDADGDVDLIASDYGSNLVWYENDHGSPPGFTEHLIDSRGAIAIAVADLNDDGRNDIVTEAGWYRNDGGAPTTFTSFGLAGSFAAVAVCAADIDRDGDLDFVRAGGDTVAWYENLSRAAPNFDEHVVSTDLDVATSVYAADVDGDGCMDILSASSGDQKIAWYENDGASPPGFTDHVVSTDAGDAQSVWGADLDRDGDVDVVSGAAGGDNKIVWYENEGCEGDLDGDGDIDLTDLATLLAVYGDTCP